MFLECYGDSLVSEHGKDSADVQMIRCFPERFFTFPFLRY